MITLVRTLSIALLLVLIHGLPAHALLFDSGSVSTSASVDLAPGFHLYGAGGAVSGWPSQSQVYGPTLWAQTQPLNAPIDLSTIVVLRTEQVTGALHFDVAPFVITRAPGGVEKVFAESPLTVHGVVEWPSGRADVLGEGLLHYTGITDGGGVYAWGLSYDFGREVAATPEPATLLLIGTGLIAGGLRARGLSRRRRTVGTLLIAALLVTGCAPTLAEIRGSSPQTETFPGQYDQVALCILDGLDNQTGWLGNGLTHITTRHVDRRAEQRALLTAKRETYVVEGAPVFEMTVAQVAPTMVRVDLRSGRTPLGADHGISPAVWVIVKDCGRARS